MIRIFLIVIFVLFGLSLINLILGTSEINRIWGANTFVCNMKIPGPADICDKKIGFFFWNLVLSIPLLSFVLGVVTKDFFQAIWVPISSVTLWGVLVEVFSKLFSLPTLYSWERSSLHYGFLSVFPAWWEFLGLPLFIFTAVIIFAGLTGFYTKTAILSMRKKFTHNT